MASGDDRAVSEVVGFILLFSVLVITFSLYQGVVVPEQNRAAELSHNTDVHRQVQTLRSAVYSAALTGAGPPTTVTLGADYPDRILASNLGASTGALTTAAPAAITIHNVTALDPETRDYVGANGSRLGPFPTRSITYRPTYAFYADPPTTRLTPAIAVNRFPNGAVVPLTEQRLIEGRTLTLVTMTGDLSHASASTTTVSPTTVSGPATRVAVTDRTGPLTLVVPTVLSAATWRTLLADELDPDGTSPTRFVRAVRERDPGHVAITLEADETYTLRLARVGIGETDAVPSPEYLTAIDGNATSVLENGTQRLTVEVRDPYNNPVSGVPLTARVTDGPGRIAGPAERPSTADGRASFTYHAPNNLAGTARVTVDVSFGPAPSDRRRVAFTLTAVDPAATTSGTQINPATAVRFRSATAAGARTIDVTFDNTAETPIEFTHARLAFVYRPGGNPPDHLESIVNATTGTPYHTDPMAPGDPLVRLDAGPLTFDPGRSTIRFAFDGTIQDGLFVVTFARESGATSTYFIAAD